ncbi:MTH1187 family thiamine-binding protein [bacterium]|nr:MTH1187 family thiamine-binding protein [bacterium]
MSVLLEFSMVPMDKGDSFSQYVAQTLDVIDRSGVSYRLNPMGTILEGEWDEVLQVVTDCYRKLSEVSDRVSCSIKIDARKGREDRLQGKIKSVEKVLNRELKK